MKNLIIGILMICAALFSCNSPDSNPPGNNAPPAAGSTLEWLVPKGQGLDGGPGKDGIPALTLPKFVALDQASYLTDDDLVVGFAHNGESRAYPHNILDWHEIVNDDVQGAKIAVTYCPLTGTGIGWDRQLPVYETTFGVSGLLYNTNLIAYDRTTDSYWSQISLKCINGTLKGSNASTYRLLETTWKLWKEMFPNSKVLSENTGYDRNYDTYPYGNYRTNDDALLFPVSPMDDRLPAKERVLAVILGGKARVYRFDNFADDTKIITDEFNFKEIIIVGNKEKNFMVAFGNTLNDEKRTFNVIKDDDPSVYFSDQDGNKYDLLGNVVDGPNKGDSLNKVTSFMAFWFSVGAFYSTTQIYSGNG